MTIAEARRVLGKDAKNRSDDEMLRDLEMAELLKNLFFDTILKHKPINPKSTSYNSLKMP